MKTGLRMEKSLEGKVILLTGGASGIGRECAIAYSREGATVAILDRNYEDANEVAQGLGNRSTAYRADVSKGADIEKAITAALKEFGSLDAVHNNAGIVGPSCPLHETTEEQWDDLLRTNLKSVYWTTKYAFEALVKSKGSILNTASMVGLLGQTDHAAYVATKGGMISLIKAMAADYAKYQIRVNAVCPAGAWTPMLEQWAAEQPNPEVIRQYLDHIHLLGYCPRGDVIADAAAFLLSSKARFITGCILPVSGGAELGYRR
jgi:meso-butanediol dehydrogenase / (S,S)-butanediol dehydrogenase / diacetyl reductase